MCLSAFCLAEGSNHGGSLISPCCSPQLLAGGTASGVKSIRWCGGSDGCRFWIKERVSGVSQDWSLHMQDK